jgi:hypothetical protein
VVDILQLIRTDDPNPKQSTKLTKADRIAHLKQEKKSLKVQMKALKSENEKLHSELQHLRRPIDPAAIQLNPYSDMVDQVSEADVLQELELLNYSVNTFVTKHIDKFEDMFKGKAPAKKPLVIGDHPQCELFDALLQHSAVDDKRTLLLDALLHHELVLMLHYLCFKGESIPRAIDQARITSDLFLTVTKFGAYYNVSVHSPHLCS